MGLNDIIADLHKIGSEIDGKVDKVECYLFGSMLFDPKKATDVDILVLYKDETSLSIAKKQFKILAKSLPLHICYLTFSEEKELNFIQTKKASLIFKF